MYRGSLPLKELYGKYPEFTEMITIVRHVYGEDFVDILDKSLEVFDKEFVDHDGTLTFTK